MNTRKMLVAASFLVSVGLTQVSNAAPKGSVVAKVGTLGAGLEYVHPVTAKVAVGFGVNGFSYDSELEESGIDYDADLDMQNIALTADYHPWENGFRLSAGLTHNGNKFSLDGTPKNTGETVDINGTSYDVGEVGSLNASLDFKSIVPYVGIGWGHAPNAGKGWAFDADLGVLFQGDPDASLSASCGANLAAVACTELLANAAAEEASFKEDVKDFDMLPVISLGASYRF